MPETQKDATPRFVSTNRIAEVFGFHPEAVRRAARNGRIPAKKIGGRWRYPRRLIEEPGKENGPPPDEASSGPGG